MTKRTSMIEIWAMRKEDLHKIFGSVPDYSTGNLHVDLLLFAKNHNLLTNEETQILENENFINLLLSSKLDHFLSLTHALYHIEPMTSKNELSKLEKSFESHNEEKKRKHSFIYIKNGESINITDEYDKYGENILYHPEEFFEDMSFFRDSTLKLTCNSFEFESIYRYFPIFAGTKEVDFSGCGIYNLHGYRFACINELNGEHLNRNKTSIKYINLSDNKLSSICFKIYPSSKLNLERNRFVSKTLKIEN